ncbi:MAG: FIST C-terminal domain-containing protein [Treponema sp.]|jgi:hypothetical protein|nr:FIST C-terminal domain-containing protein [Treponema sp.]
MAIKVAASRSGDMDALITAIGQPQVKAVIYFFSVACERLEPQKAIKRAFPQAACIGASMIGGWCSSGALDKGIVAMSLSVDEVEDAFILMQEGVKEAPSAAGKKILNAVKARLTHRNISPNRYLGLIFFDGLCRGEEIMQVFTWELGLNLPLIGGAAADELTFTKTLVAAEEKISSDGVAVLIMKMKIPFFYSHYGHCTPATTSFVITKAEPIKRIVWEINQENAAAYYAKTIGVSSADNLQSGHFAKNPLGIVIGNAVYIRSISGVVDGKGLQFYCSLEEETEVHLLKPGDLIAHTHKAVQEAALYIPNIQGALLFNCVLRYLELQELKKTDAFNRLFSHLNCIGFNTYGEEFHIHHNQTLTAVFFGR